MKDFGIMLIVILAIIGLCAVLGIATRGTEKNDNDRDSTFNTLMRGLGTFCAIFAAITAIGVVIYLITLAFT